ncbi:MAG: hypothetical protein VKJ46_14790 [Leptolyngbyaceae bacterium]|nr:hypothetical protein [Leptolyngbyaceae bacterium]
MKPKFADAIAWEQAELLMQPVFIRLIDNLRKQLEQSDWKGTYQDVPIWAEEIPEEIKAKVSKLQEKLKTASPEQAVEIERALAHLPSPLPGYQLCLQKQDQQINIDLWDLCYQICFQNYQIPRPPEVVDILVEIDTSLIDETGEVDWQQLDTKAQRIVGQVFANLPDALVPSPLL